MSTKLSKAAVARAIEHLSRFGDTDVFPHLIELVFFQEQKEHIAAEISGLDLDNFTPMQSMETIAPKGRYSFRTVHQLFPLETLLFTAAVIEIGSDLENYKIPPDQSGPFAYRFSSLPEATLFQPDRTYKNWLEWQKERLKSPKGPPCTEVIFTDIADYYQRIGFHRLENCLDSATANKGVKRFIEKTIKHIRSRQSFGIPVGGSAARILAEAVLADSDNALISEGYDFTRYIDDYRIFIREGQSPYSALAFLADQLASEGLSLNAQKTRVLTSKEFECYLGEQITDVLDASGRKAFESLVHSLYFDEEPDPDDVRTLQSFNLLEMLREEIKQETWDFGKIKAIFRALRIIEDADSAGFFVDNFALFIPFVKEMVLYFDVISNAANADNGKLKAQIFDQLEGAAASVPVIRAWLYELAIRQVVQFTPKELARIRKLEPLDNRQLFIVRGMYRDVSFFRRNKTRFDQIRDFEKTPFILGATCLPKDEFVTWIGAIKPSMERPLDGLFCDWAKSKVGRLSEIVQARSALARD